MIRVVFTGGGTGGHVMPNFAVIDELKSRDVDVDMLYIGSKRGMERAMVEKYGMRFVSVSCGKLRRYLSLENLKDAFRLPVGLLQALRELRRFKPNVVFSKGGYVSVPVVIAAWMLKIPVVLHESDLVPGLANKISFKFAKKICVSFEESRSYLPAKVVKKAVVTGNPVRTGLLGGDREKGRKLAGFDRHRPVILVMGGSSGAEQINGLVRGSISELVKRYQVIHLTGKGNLDIGLSKKGYKQFEFLGPELFDIYALCEMVVTRGGANSLAEVGMLKKRAVIIPLGTGASRGDQIENARIYAQNFGWSVLSGEISTEDFVKAIDMAMDNGLNPDAEVKNGSKEIVDLLLRLA